MRKRGRHDPARHPPPFGHPLHYDRMTVITRLTRQWCEEQVTTLGSGKAAVYRASLGKLDDWTLWERIRWLTDG